MHKHTTVSQGFPVFHVANPIALKIMIPCPASSPLYPAKKLYVAETPTITRGIIIKGYNSPNSIPRIWDCPAFITINGTAAQKSNIILEALDKPPLDRK